MIELRGLTRSFPVGNGKRKDVLKGIDLAFPDKGFVTILGPSGSGKTTLLRLIGVLDEPSEGSILINGEDVSTLSEKEKDLLRHREIGSIFQDFNLIPHLNVEENIALPFRLKNGFEEEKERVEELINKLNLSEIRNSLPSKLSGGEAQRVAFARAIALNQRIVLADEPTASLDEENARIILDTLKEASKERLVIMVTHNEEIAKEYSDYVVRLRKGSLVQSSLPDIQKGSLAGVGKTRAKGKLSSLFLLPSKRVLRNKRHYALSSIVTMFSFAAVAVSIAIMSGGFNTVARWQEDLLSGLPITIRTYYMNYTNSAMQTRVNTVLDDGFIHSGVDDKPAFHVNEINDEFIEYVKKGIDESEISLAYGGSFPFLSYDYQGKPKVEYTSSLSSGEEYLNSFFTEYSPLQISPLDKDSFLHSYEPIYGHYPENDNEAYLVVNLQNSVPGNVISSLGQSETKVSYEDVCTKEFTFLSNDDYYIEFTSTKQVKGKFLKEEVELASEGKKADKVLSLLSDALSYYEKGEGEKSATLCQDVASYFEEEESTHTLRYYVPTYSENALRELIDNPSKGKKVRISGIFRPNRERVGTQLAEGIYFSEGLRDALIEENKNSRIAQELRYHLTYDGSGKTFALPEVYSILNNVNKSGTNQTELISSLYTFFTNRRDFGEETYVQGIYIRPKTLEESSLIKDYLDAYNEGKPASEHIIYNDLSGDFNALIDTYFTLFVILLIAVVAVICFTNALVCFILTQLEIEKRRKEIAIYRSLGASKGYVTSLLVLETGFVAFLSTIGSIILCYCFLPILNKIIETAVTQAYVPRFAFLPGYLAFAVIVLSSFLACLSSFLPCFLAARKPPSSYLKGE